MTTEHSATFLFPCAGHSRRYPGMRPKWMLTTPDGDLAIQKAVASVAWTGQRRIVAIRRAHDLEYGAADVLRRAFDDAIEIVVLETDTDGPAHTVAEMIRIGGVSGPIAIKDADSFFDPVEYPGHSFVACTDLRRNLDVSRVGAKSFISINENALIRDVTEKDVCSNYISSGLYGIRDAGKFLDIFSQYRSEIEGEIFVSHLIRKMLTEGEVFHPLFVDAFVDVGTKIDWMKYVAERGTYIVDIDGVIVKNQSRFFAPFWGTPYTEISENTEALRYLQERGAQLIFTTSRPEEFRKVTTELLVEAGLRPHALVMDCNHARRFLVNDYANSNPFPSAVAINIPRNAPTLRDHIGA